MAIRTLTNDEYIKLADKVMIGAVSNSIAQMKQVHRLLCEGRKVEDLTPLEQFYAPAFDGLQMAQIPNDYGWEPAVEVSDDAPADLTLRESLAVSQPPAHAPIKRRR